MEGRFQLLKFFKSPKASHPSSPLPGESHIDGSKSIAGSLQLSLDG
jgi:hypothetical protein